MAQKNPLQRHPKSCNLQRPHGIDHPKTKRGAKPKLERNDQMALLNTAAGNTKILKSQKGTDFRIASLSLYPDDKICPAAILAGCKAPCLVSAGRGAMGTVAQGRKNKTAFWHRDKDLFLETLEKEMRNFIKLCNKQGKRAAFRLNTISDIPWERYGLPDLFPEALLYDYTKSAARLGKTPENYRLMFSYSQETKYQKQVARALETDCPIAVVFRGFVPSGSYFMGREIIDGDKSDLINLEKGQGKIIGLKLKGGKATQQSQSRFIVEPWQATNCPAQMQNDCNPHNLANAGRGFAIAAE